MADIEIRAFGLRLLVVIGTQKEPEEVGEPEFVSNTAGSFSIAEPADAFYQDPYEQETDVRFGFGG
jgi:hypothetical protein